MVLRPHPPQSRSQQLAQRKAVQDEAFFREVDDAVRQDEMTNAFRRYALPVGIALLVALAALGGYLWWQHRSEAAVERRGEALTTALDQIDNGQLAAADMALIPLAAPGDPATSAVARLARGGLALRQGRAAEAAALFAAVSADADAPQPLRDLATVRQVAASFDTMPPGQAIARLQPLAVPGAPFFGSAGELLGMLYLKQGRRELAAPLFGAIARDTTVPESMRRRIRQFAGVLGVDTLGDVARGTAGPR